MFNLIHKLIVALLGKSKNINTMANNEQYPRFIPDKPTGDDVFEGQSQTNLANNICKYIRSNDSASYRERGQMPRIIGLEGKWGSGKSNVVENIKKHLDGEGYHTFTYDACGHQEDLQRRSILETLTNDLIENKVLGGKVEIKMRNLIKQNGRTNYHYYYQIKRPQLPNLKRGLQVRLFGELF